MALSKIDVANMVTGATPVANGGTGQTTFAAAGLDKRPNAKPIIVNGNMAVAQRSTSVTSQNTAGYKTVDRMYANIDSAGSYTVIQESLTSGNAYNNGFKKAFRLDCTTADASLAADNNLILFYFLEGQDLQMIKKGTSNAEKLTLSFWVKSNKTGTAQVNLVDNDNSRICGATYTISSANTWEQKVVNYAADTTGAFDNDNNKSLTIEWFLDSGSNYSGGAVPTAWEASSNSDRDQGNLDIAGSTDNDFAITGIQLEVGEYSSTTLPPFQHESYGDNLKRCQRYFEMSFEYGTAPAAGTAAPDGRVFGSWDGNSARTQIDWKVTKRAAPTVTVYRGSNTGSGTGTGTANFIYGGSWNNHTCTANNADDSHCSLTGSTSNFTTNAAHVADLNFTADAEL